MWSYFLLLQMSLTAALSTDWSPSWRHAGEQAVAEVHPRRDKSGDSRLRSPKRQRLDAAPDETELAKQQPTVHATWRLMDRSESSRTPRSRTEVKAPQTLSSPVSRWIHRLRVAHHRKSVFSGLSRSLLECIHSAIRSTPSSIPRRCCGTVDGGPHV